jgi:serine/threonine-protein kinase
MIGRVFDRKYRIERLLGKGGMGEVYEAVHVVLERKVAVKVMHAELVTDNVATERFMREALAASEIGHANIVDVQDVGIEEDGAVFIVMELLEGKTLDKLMNEKGSLHPALATKIILGVLTGLHAAHRKGIVHRDLKPENVVITVDSSGQEVVKLLDFGIAVFQKHKELEEDMSLTAPGRLVGTPNYLSPEQIRGKKEIDGRVDVWAAGIMLYEMLTGTLPFDGESYNEVLGQILLDEPKPMQQIVPRVPDQLVEIVDKALVKDRGERYQNAGEFIGDLYMLQGPRTTPAESVATISGSYARVQTGDYETRPSSPGSGSWAGDRKAVTADIEAVDPLEASSKTGDSTPMVWRDGAGRAEGGLGSVFWAASAVAAVAIIGIVVVLVFFVDSGEPVEPPPAVTAPAVEEPAPLPEPLPEVAEPAEEEEEEEEERPPEPDLVKVVVEGLPDGAQVYLGSDLVGSEFERSRSRDPFVLRAEAPGYEPFEKAVVLRRDLTIVVSMRKKDVAPIQKVAPAAAEPEGKGPREIVASPFGE